MITKPSSKNIVFYFINRLFLDIFIISAVVLLLLLALEDFRTGVVSNWINLKLALLIPSVSGIISLLTSKYQSDG